MFEMVFSSTAFQNFEYPLMSWVQKSLGMNYNNYWWIFYIEQNVKTKRIAIVFQLIVFTIFHGYDCILGVKLMLVSLCTFSVLKLIMLFH